MVDNVLGKSAKAEEQLNKLEAKLKDLKAQLDSNKDKVLTKDDIAKIIEQLKQLGKDLD